MNYKDKRKNGREIKSWGAFWDDIIFLKHLRKMGYFETSYKNFNDEIYTKIANQEAYKVFEKGYYVGFPGNHNEDEGDIDDENEMLGSIRLLDNNWVKQYTTQTYRTRCLNSKNRILDMTKNTLGIIKREMKKLCENNVTHIHKYECPTTYKTKYCNAIPNKRGIANKEETFSIMKGDKITEEWLFQTAVGLNNCKEWYTEVTDKSKCDETFPLPVASCHRDMIKPDEIKHSPEICFPQENEGTCGISAFSSAFAYLYDTKMGLGIYIKKTEYLKILCTPVKSKSPKSAAMIFLMKIMEKKPFSKKYECKRLKQVPWREFLKKSDLYDSVILCILCTTKMSKDHIIAISQGWIFDGNLKYAITCNEDNLNWCAGHGNENETFGGFYEQVQIRTRKK